MKFRIIGTIVLLVILGAMYVVFGEGEHSAPTVSNSQPAGDADSNALKGLKIN